MVKIALIGYGKMGKIIESIAKQRGNEVVSIIDPNCDTAQKEITKESLKDADVCIDFTHPTVIMENIKKISSLGKNIVIGTTGWYDRMPEVESMINKNKVGAIWSGNFSIGVNVFFRIVESAASLFNNIHDYDAMVHEIHHNQKADSPSGTASMIGKIILKNMSRKNKIITDKLERKIEPNELHISSVRVGTVPGTHEVLFDSAADTIELKHTARTREGFALGAVMAAEFIADKKGFYGIEDLMNNLIQD
jgi:4-hydroxy-tetrahydrodipicolinate reductase